MLPWPSKVPGSHDVNFRLLCQAFRTFCHCQTHILFPRSASVPLFFLLVASKISFLLLTVWLFKASFKFCLFGEDFVVSFSISECVESVPTPEHITLCCSLLLQMCSSYLPASSGQAYWHFTFYPPNLATGKATCLLLQGVSSDN